MIDAPGSATPDPLRATSESGESDAVPPGAGSADDGLPVAVALGADELDEVEAQLATAAATLDALAGDPDADAVAGATAWLD